MFETNPLIQKMAQSERWAISSKSKHPLSVKGINAFNKNPQFRQFQNDSDLVSLTDIEKISVLNNANRAYRMNAVINHIIAIDIEAYASEEVRQHLLKIPFGYGEISKSGGLHLFVELPIQVIQQLKYIPILSTNFATGKTWGFEVLTQNHFITFTKNEIPSNPNGDVNILYELLDILANKAEEKNAYQKSKYRIQNEDIINDNVKFIAKEIPQSKKQNIETLDMQSFNNDYSRLEWHAAMSIAGTIATKRRNSKELYEDITNNEIITVIYKILQKHLEHRDKHESYRDGLPYLKYVAANAWAYCNK